MVAKTANLGLARSELAGKKAENDRLKLKQKARKFTAPFLLQDG
jgi:hypothetical protein